MKIELGSATQANPLKLGDTKERVLQTLQHLTYIIDEHGDMAVDDSYKIYFESLDWVFLFNDEDEVVYFELFDEPKEQRQLTIADIDIDFTSNPLPLLEEKDFKAYFDYDCSYFIPKLQLMLFIEDDVLKSVMYAEEGYFQTFFEDCVAPEDRM